MSHNHPVNFVNKIHKMLDKFVISKPCCLIFFKSEGTFNNLLPLKKLGVQHVQRVLILNGHGLKYSNIQIPEQYGTLCHRWYNARLMDTDFWPPHPVNVEKFDEYCNVTVLNFDVK